MPHQGLDQYHAFVRLPGDFDQLRHGGPVMRQAERPEPKRCLQFRQVFAPSLLALAIRGPVRDRQLQLGGHKRKQGGRRQLIQPQHHARKAQVTELYGEPQAIGRAPVLVNQRQVSFTESVLPDELLRAFGQRQELFPFRCR